MLTLRRSSLVSILLIGVLLSAWAVWGSASSSRSTFVWLAAVAVGLVVAVIMAIRDGRPTRSIAHVLYDAEHPSAGSAGAPAINSPAPHGRHAE